MIPKPDRSEASETVDARAVVDAVEAAVLLLKKGHEVEIQTAGGDKIASRLKPRPDRDLRAWQAKIFAPPKLIERKADSECRDDLHTEWATHYARELLYQLERHLERRAEVLADRDVRAICSRVLAVADHGRVPVRLSKRLLWVARYVYGVADYRSFRRKVRSFELEDRQIRNETECS